MKFSEADYLSFADLAGARASEPDTRSYDSIIGQLHETYRSAEFEGLLAEISDEWPLRKAASIAL